MRTCAKRLRLPLALALAIPGIGCASKAAKPTPTACEPPAEGKPRGGHDSEAHRVCRQGAVRAHA